MSLNENEKELIELKLTGIRGEMQANNEVMLLKLDQILEQTKKTNGRVNKHDEELEKQHEKMDSIERKIAVFDYFSKRPILLVLIGLGLVVLFNLEGFSSLIKIIK